MQPENREEGGKRPRRRTPEVDSAAAGPPAPDAERARLIEELRQANERLVLASVHAQELAEAAQRQSEEWSAVLNSLTEGVIVVNAAGRLVLANPVAREMLELRRLGPLQCAQDWTQLELRALDGKPLRFEDRPLARVTRGERFSDVEVVLVCHDGSTRRLVFNGSAVRDETGAVSLGILTFRDVTELRKLEQTKEEYVSLISHDLRAPLTAIAGRAQLLVRLSPGTDPAIVRRDAEAILASAQRMDAMIQDLVETSRLEAGTAALHRGPIDLPALIREAIGSLAATWGHPRIQVEAPARLPVVRADPGRIERVIVNLLSNALKFSPPDSPIEVRVSSPDREVVISVIDHGIGIPAEALPHLFEKYFRTEAGKQRGGLGLGLYLSRLIVEAHGGRIWAASVLGKGSTVSFSLPVE